MNMPHRYQYGSLTRRKRIRTEDVWQFRFYETCPDGKRHRRSKIIGMLNEYPTPTDALRILERFRLRLNLQNRLGLPVTLDALADDYVQKELPLLRYGTQQAHRSSLHRWIRPRWGGCLVYEIKPIEVEQWLRSLPLADKSKVNLRSLLHLSFSAWTAVGDIWAESSQTRTRRIDGRCKAAEVLGRARCGVRPRSAEHQTLPPCDG